MLILYFPILILAHFAGDFLFQTRWMALNKSLRNDALVIHVAIYTATVMAGFAVFAPSLLIIAIFGWITFTSHFLTDAITSRVSRHLHEQSKMGRFWHMIGLDQTIHFLTLWYTLKYLSNLT